MASRTGGMFFMKWPFCTSHRARECRRGRGPAVHHISDRMTFSSCRQLPIGQPLAYDGHDERIQPLKSVTAHVRGIQAEGELINVLGKVLLADLVVNPVDAALQDGPDALNSVGSSAALGIDASHVIDRLVAKEQPIKAQIAGRFIREQSRAYFYVVMDGLLQAGRAGIGQRHRNRLAVTGAHSDHGSLAHGAASGLELFVFVLVALLPADETLVDLDHAAQLVELPAARLTKPMESEPCRPLRDTNLLRQLHRRDSLSSRDQQVHRVKPLVQGNVRPLENGSRSDREIEVTSVAAVEAALAGCDALQALARRANRTVLPEPRFEVEPCGLSIREHLEKLKRGYCAFAH